MIDEDQIPFTDKSSELTASISVFSSYSSIWTSLYNGVLDKSLIVFACWSFLTCLLLDILVEVLGLKLEVLDKSLRILVELELSANLPVFTDERIC
jgi:hypothetical protein